MRRRAMIRIFAALAVSLAPACGKKKGEHPPPAAKPISPPAVEPLPAPRASGQFPSPAESPTETTTPTAHEAGAKPKR